MNATAMQAPVPAGPAPGRVALLGRLGRLGLSLLPAALLLAVSLRASGETAPLLWLGSLVQGLGAVLVLTGGQGRREGPGAAEIMLCVLALSWILLAGSAPGDWVVYLARGALLAVALGLFARQLLRDSGAVALRRAHRVARLLTRRRSWPERIEEYRALSEVRALREALHLDASPALNLLHDPRPGVRLAALAALEGRTDWKPGQAEQVLKLARETQDGAVRAAALYALAGVEDRSLTEHLAEFLRDPAQPVRLAAAAVVLWDSERRWPWVRLAVRHALSDPRCQDDGPLRCGEHALAPEALGDLMAWASEKGLVALRSALTLGAYYHRALAAGHDPSLPQALAQRLADPHTPSMLRVELARILEQHGELDLEALRQLLGPSSPAPVRLIAAEALLARGRSAEAVAALHDLARLPNREMALATADVVQRRLGVDLGLPRGEPLPPPTGRLAADVARRVQLWSARPEPDDDADVPAIEEVVHRAPDDW